MVSLSGKLQICAVITKLFLLLMWRSHLHLNSSEHFPLLPHVSLALWDVRRQTLQVFCSAALLRGKYDCCSLWMKCLFLEELHTHSYFLYPACCVGWISLSTEENKGLNSDRERERAMKDWSWAIRPLIIQPLLAKAMRLLRLDEEVFGKTLTIQNAVVPSKSFFFLS